MNKDKWTKKCLELCDFIYARVPVDIFMQIYSKHPECHKNDDIEDIIERSNYPIFLEPKDNCFYSNSYSLNEILEISKEQEDCDYYIPEYDEIKDYANNSYQSNYPAYSKIRVFVSKRANESEIDVIMADLWSKLCLEFDKERIVHELLFKLAVRNESELAMLSRLVDECAKGTMLCRLKGWSIESYKKKYKK